MSALDLPSPLAPPPKWVDATEPNFARVRAYVLALRLGSGSYVEFERGVVSFKLNQPTSEDGEALVMCECRQLGLGQMSARDFVQRAYGRGRQHFEEDAQTAGTGKRPQQGDLQLTLLDGKDKVVTRVTSKLKRRTRGGEYVDVTDHDLAGELRESSRTSASVAQSLAGAVVSMHGQNRRAESEAERLVNERIHITNEGFGGVIQGLKDVADDKVVAADLRARAEGERKLLEAEKDSGKGWLERVMQTEVGREIAKHVVPVVAPAAGKLAMGITQAATSGLDLLSLKGQVRAEQIRTEVALEKHRLRKLAEAEAAKGKPPKLGEGEPEGS